MEEHRVRLISLISHLRHTIKNATRSSTFKLKTFLPAPPWGFHLRLISIAGKRTGKLNLIINYGRRRLPRNHVIAFLFVSPFLVYIYIYTISPPVQFRIFRRRKSKNVCLICFRNNLTITDRPAKVIHLKGLRLNMKTDWIGRVTLFCRLRLINKIITPSLMFSLYERKFPSRRNSVNDIWITITHQ